MQKALYSREYAKLLRLLRAKRKSAQITQAELAQRLAWRQEDVSKCETGVRRLDVIELKLWLDALGSNLGAFVAELS